MNKHKRKGQPQVDTSKLFEFKKNLNAAPDAGEVVLDFNIDSNFMDNLNENINVYISREEIFDCIKKLKNDKASGEDGIINETTEYIKSTAHQFINIYEKLFNLIFDCEIIPESWVIGKLKPIYKNKGDSSKPKNYRPITILSCFGKLFTSVLCNRFCTYSEDFAVIKENQCGFRPNYSTTDNIFTLYSLFEILKCKKKKLYCAFVDFEKAFDTVWRNGLFYKMIMNMYQW